MKAITFEGIKKVKVAEVPDPEILEPTDAIVKVDLAAICGSDMHVYHGRESGIDKGTIMGHEFCGTIFKPGPSVSKFKTGERVLSPFTVNCGNCLFCDIGLTARCVKSALYGWVENGKGLQGVHAEYVRVPMADSTLVPLPDDISSEQAVLLSDIASTGYFGAEQAEITESTKNCLVIGCGPVGIMAVDAAKHLGAKNIFAMDQYEFRLNKAKESGAIPVNFMNSDEIESIKRETNGIGFDTVIEAVGSASSMKMAFEMLRPGGILSTVGVQAYENFSFTPPDIYDKNLILKAGRCSSRTYSEKLIPVVQRGEFHLEDVITHTFNLEEGEKAYRFFDEEKDRCLKVLLEP